MALKMRFLYYSGKSKMKAMADVVKKEFGLEQSFNAIDIIPPAYACEKERLVILAVSGKGSPDDVLRRFCLELDAKTANNVCLIVDGDEKMGQSLMDIISSTGTNVVNDTLYVKLGGLPFIGGKLSEDEKKSLIAWVEKSINNLK